MSLQIWLRVIHVHEASRNLSSDRSTAGSTYSTGTLNGIWLTENEEDEYEAWKRSEPIAGEGVDPIKYWVELRDRHPSLSKFAIDMLSIPGSSCECERLFSELGDLLEPRRRSISPQLLAAIQCDRRWIRAGFGSGEVPVKGVISDEEMDAKYGVHKWDIS
ncbi:Dimer-Tnp-hAT multi-domain protein [Pyrenophora tritici-repentis]|uniref:HAT C-terminal dimerisation domain-containing protein n=1 Tax=Pyrenophora tritici-repentis TaxID=45151 RepID=A0A5M9L653_9PLEO|nr:Dimer-Tnp-hAT multi-domain protein [Pyrenophora tritici-repentis]KAF7564276.1 hypothetical protein PtrM4_152990 [Pyrenophora tritici-repentis]KAF7568237.1 hypothetical protein PtrM4_128500 [Pyrenophora tritici-repentis]